MKDEIAFVRNSRSNARIENQANRLRIGARRDRKIVFQLLLIAVVRETDPGIDFFVAHGPKRRHVSVPIGWIVADEIIPVTGKFADAFRNRVRICTLQSQTEQSWRN